MRDVQLGYIAGMLDGEGCIYLKPVKANSKRNFTYDLTVNIYNTNKESLIFISSLIGGYIYLNQKPVKKYKPCYRLVLHGKKAGELLTVVLPYLIIKKAQAILALEFVSTLEVGGRKLSPINTEKRNFIAREMRKLKRQTVTLDKACLVRET